MKERKQLSPDTLSQAKKFFERHFDNYSSEEDLYWRPVGREWKDELHKKEKELTTQASPKTHILEEKGKKMRIGLSSSYHCQKAQQTGNSLSVILQNTFHYKYLNPIQLDTETLRSGNFTLKSEDKLAKLPGLPKSFTHTIKLTRKQIEKAALFQDSIDEIEDLDFFEKSHTGQIEFFNSYKRTTIKELSNYQPSQYPVIRKAPNRSSVYYLHTLNGTETICIKTNYKFEPYYEIIPRYASRDWSYRNPPLTFNSFSELLNRYAPEAALQQEGVNSRFPELKKEIQKTKDQTTQEGYRITPIKNEIEKNEKNIVLTMKLEVRGYKLPLLLQVTEEEKLRIEKNGEWKEYNNFEELKEEIIKPAQTYCAQIENLPQFLLLPETHKSNAYRLLKEHGFFIQRDENHPTQYVIVFSRETVKKTTHSELLRDIGIEIPPLTTSYYKDQFQLWFDEDGDYILSDGFYSDKFQEVLHHALTHASDSRRNYSKAAFNAGKRSLKNEIDKGRGEKTYWFTPYPYTKREYPFVANLNLQSEDEEIKVYNVSVQEDGNLKVLEFVEPTKKPRVLGEYRDMQALITHFIQPPPPPSLPNPILATIRRWSAQSLSTVGRWFKQAWLRVKRRASDPKETPTTPESSTPSPQVQDDEAPEEQENFDSPLIKGNEVPTSTGKSTQEEKPNNINPGKNND